MGMGSYSQASAMNTRALIGAHDSSNEQLFTNRHVDNKMNPKDLTLRESRDSAEHPNSLAMILGLDLTGSMGSIPQMMVRDGLPNIMSKIIQSGELDPQVLFLGVGDHECDGSPLQVGQFESSDTLLDEWLLATYLEGGGGGNKGESYFLAWYVAAMHTAIDCLENRGRKGILITIGDEPVLDGISASKLQGIMGQGQYSDVTAKELLAQAQEMYHVYHIHLLSTGAGRRFKEYPIWPSLLGDNLLMAQSPDEVADLIVTVVGEHQNEGDKPDIGSPSNKAPEVEVVL